MLCSQCSLLRFTHVCLFKEIPLGHLACHSSSWIFLISLVILSARVCVNKSFWRYFTYDGLEGVNSPARRSTSSQRCEGVIPLYRGLHPAGEKPATHTTRLQETWFPLLTPPKITPLPLVMVISQQRLGYGFLFKYPAWEDLSLLNP